MSLSVEVVLVQALKVRQSIVTSRYAAHVLPAGRYPTSDRRLRTIVNRLVYVSYGIGRNTYATPAAASWEGRNGTLTSRQLVSSIYRSCRNCVCSRRVQHPVVEK